MHSFGSKRHLKRLAFAAAFTAVATVLVPVNHASAAPARTDCPRTTGSASNSASAETRWSAAAGLVFTAAQSWCVYDETLDRRIVWQADGNLVAYTGAHSGGVATWDTRTGGYNTTKGATLAFQTDGNVTIYDAKHSWIWSTQTAGNPHAAYYFSIAGGPNRVSDGMGAVASVHFDNNPHSQWYARIESPLVNDGSGEAMPIGRLGSWRQTFVEDFNTNSSSADFAANYADSWCGYADGTAGRYWNSKVISAHDGVMDFNLANGEGAAGSFGPPGNCWTNTYGRYSIRFKAIGASSYDMAKMLWPSSDRWGDGEEDFPEGNLGWDMYLYQHGVGCDDSCAQNIAGLDTNQIMTGWHTTTVEWLPNSLKFYLDNRLVYSTAKQVPASLHRDTLQMYEPMGAIPTTGHLYVAWVAHWDQLGSH